jgi:antitoxin ParD1/3/4
VAQEEARFPIDWEALLAKLDAAIVCGVAAADAGRVRSAAEVFDRLEAKYQALGERRELGN